MYGYKTDICILSFLAFSLLWKLNLFFIDVSGCLVYDTQTKEETLFSASFSITAPFPYRDLNTAAARWGPWPAVSHRGFGSPQLTCTALNLEREGH